MTKRDPGQGALPPMKRSGMPLGPRGQRRPIPRSQKAPRQWGQPGGRRVKVGQKAPRRPTGVVATGRIAPTPGKRPAPVCDPAQVPRPRHSPASLHQQEAPSLGPGTLSPHLTALPPSQGTTHQPPDPAPTRQISSTEATTTRSPTKPVKQPSTPHPTSPQGRTLPKAAWKRLLTPTNSLSY